MRVIDKIYIDGTFVTPAGDNWLDLSNPSTEERIGRVRLGDARDANAAVAAAKRAFPAMAATSRAERTDMLTRLGDAVLAEPDQLIDAMREEYGAPAGFSSFSAQNAATAFYSMAEAVADYQFDRIAGRSSVRMLPRGVVAAITPWNSNYGFIASKIAHAIGSGSSIVVKPAEQSAIQTQVFTERLHAAGLPAGIFNIVNGTGPVAGAALTGSPDVATISFTGSTLAAARIQSAAIPGMKRLILELGGKGATVLLADADLDEAIPIALMSGLTNSGQACVAGSRILVPRSHLPEIAMRLKEEAEKLKVGDPRDTTVRIGPMASSAQWERVQSYIEVGLAEGATLLTGGLGRPDRLSRGWFVRPTIFINATNDMRIAREEIFGPVLTVIAYDDEEDAAAIANDSDYGLQSYILSKDLERARRFADRLLVGRVVINGAPHDPAAPFGGFRQSGLGREIGAYGLDGFLEPRAVLVP
jgi:aldehyde dehydrogenase (NAD+)